MPLGMEVHEWSGNMHYMEREQILKPRAKVDNLKYIQINRQLAIT